MQRALSALAVLVIGLLAASSVLAESACGDGERRLNPGEPCIPATMANYLFCLSQSGGGRIEVSTKEESSSDKKYGIKVTGQGSGVVVKAGGSVEGNRSEAIQAAQTSTEKRDPSLAANCKEFAASAQAPPPPPSDKRPMGPLLNGVGLDHSDIDPSGWLSLGSAQACRDLCYMRNDCKAMTYVTTNRSCWLKYEVPQQSVNGDEISSIKQ